MCPGKNRVWAWRTASFVQVGKTWRKCLCGNQAAKVNWVMAGRRQRGPKVIQRDSML